MVMQAKQQGNSSFQPGAGTVNLVIKTFVKPNDQVTLTVREQTHAPVTIEVNSFESQGSASATVAGSLRPSLRPRSRPTM